VSAGRAACRRRIASSCRRTRISSSFDRRDCGSKRTSANRFRTSRYTTTTPRTPSPTTARTPNLASQTPPRAADEFANPTGYNFWTRAQQLRDLARYFRSIDVVDQERLKRWALTSTFKKDFEGRVKGLGPAVYQWLVMRQGVDTVKPDVHLRRSAEAAVGRTLNDNDVIELTSRAATRIGVKAFELDWRIWEASREGASLPDGPA
jgi:hypothetical protein